MALDHTITWAIDGSRPHDNMGIIAFPNKRYWITVIVTVIA